MTSENGPRPGPPRSRWPRRRWVAAGVCCLLVLAGLLVVANVVLTRYVKDGVVRALRCTSGDDTITPTVTLGSTPVLLDLASREIGQVTITGLAPSDLEPSSSGAGGTAPGGTAPGGTAAGGPGQDDGDLTITLRGVGLGDPPTMKSAQARVRMGWAGLEADSSDDAADLAGATLGEDDGLLEVTLPEQVAGQPVKVLVNAEPDGRALTVTPEWLVIGDRRVGVGLVKLLTGDLLEDEDGESRLKPRSLDLGLPEGTTLRALQVHPDGMTLDLDIDPDRVGRDGPDGSDCLA